MNKYQEAISSITFTMHMRVKPKSLSVCEDANLSLLKELVDRATPMKVFEEIALNGSTYNACPYCGNQVRSHMTEFCPGCGQALAFLAEVKHE